MNDIKHKTNIYPGELDLDSWIILKYVLKRLGCKDVFQTSLALSDVKWRTLESRVKKIQSYFQKGRRSNRIGTYSEPLWECRIQKTSYLQILIVIWVV